MQPKPHNLLLYFFFFCKYHGKLTERLKTCIAKAGLILDGLLRFFSFNGRSLTVIRRKRSPLIVRYKHIMSNKRAIMFVNYRNFPQKVQIIRRNSVAKASFDDLIQKMLLRENLICEKI